MKSHDTDDADYLRHEAEFYEEPEPEKEKPSWLKRSLNGVIITSAVVASTATVLLTSQKVRMEPIMGKKSMPANFVVAPPPPPPQPPQPPKPSLLEEKPGVAEGGDK